MLSKTIECLSMSLAAHKEGGFSLFRLLFEVVSGSFQPVLACYGFFRVVPLFKSDDITKIFGLQIYYKSTSCRFYYKVLLQSWVALVYYKVGQLLLQSGASFLL